MLDNGMICKGGGFVIQRHDEMRVLDIEHGTLTTLIFTTTGRMSDFDTNKIRLCWKVVSSLLLWIPLLSLPLLLLVWLHYLFDTLILNFFIFYQNGPLQGILIRIFTRFLHWNAIIVRFGFIRQEKIKWDVRKRKRVKRTFCMHQHQINNNKSLPLYTYVMSVDKEPSFNETIRQNTRKCFRTKWKYSVLSPEMFLTFL